MSLRLAAIAAHAHDRCAQHVAQLQSAQLDVVVCSYLESNSVRNLVADRDERSELGHRTEFASALRAICPRMFLEPQLRLITNAGGVNPLACAQMAADILREQGQGELPVGVVCGDCILSSIEEIVGSGCPLDHCDGVRKFSDVRAPVVAAQAWISGAPIAEAIQEGARLVIAGTVAPDSLVAGAVIAQFDWPRDDWDRIAAATVAGKLLSAGASLVTPQASSSRHVSPIASPPIVEFGSEGQIVIAPSQRHEAIDAAALRCHIAKDVMDPEHYLTPNVDAYLTSVVVGTNENTHRINCWGATGRPAPESFEVTLFLDQGFKCSRDFHVVDVDIHDAAQRLSEAVFGCLQRSQVQLSETHMQILRTRQGSPQDQAVRHGPAVVRVSAVGRTRESMEEFQNECAAFAYDAGPTCRLLADCNAIEPNLCAWPTVIPKEFVTARAEVRPASQWC